MTKIYLIRHGEAEGNLYRRAQGHWDGKITPRGELQLSALADRFRGVHLDAVYSSDLSRAAATAEALAKERGLELIKTPRLREMCIGVWEGQPWGELEYKWPEQMRLFNGDPARFQVEGSESFDAVTERMTSVLAEIARENDGKTIAVVSHGLAIKIFLMGQLGIASGGPDALMHGDNTSVSLLEYSGGKFKVEYYNDNSHLGELSTMKRQRWQHGTGPDSRSLRFVPFNFKDKADSALYLDSYRDSWVVAHGSEAGFVPGIYLSSAKSHSRWSRESVVKVMSVDDFAGAVELDTERGKNEGCGWVSFLYLRPEFRGQGLGVQLIGYAAAHFMSLGRKALRLHCAVTNGHAIEFYKNHGFYEIGIDDGVASKQYLLEKKL